PTCTIFWSTWLPSASTTPSTSSSPPPSPTASSKPRWRGRPSPKLDAAACFEGGGGGVGKHRRPFDLDRHVLALDDVAALDAGGKLQLGEHQAGQSHGAGQSLGGNGDRGGESQRQCAETGLDLERDRELTEIHLEPETARRTDDAQRHALMKRRFEGEGTARPDAQHGGLPLPREERVPPGVEQQAALPGCETRIAHVDRAAQVHQV